MAYFRISGFPENSTVEFRFYDEEGVGLTSWTSSGVEEYIEDSLTRFYELDTSIPTNAAELRWRVQEDLSYYSSEPIEEDLLPEILENVSRIPSNPAAVSDVQITVDTSDFTSSVEQILTAINLLKGEGWDDDQTIVELFNEIEESTAKLQVIADRFTAVGGTGGVVILPEPALPGMLTIVVDVADFGVPKANIPIKATIVGAGVISVDGKIIEADREQIAKTAENGRAVFSLWPSNILKDGSGKTPLPYNFTSETLSLNKKVMINTSGSLIDML